MAFPTTSVLDNFNRADSTSIGANWTEITNVQIVSNTLQSVSGGGAAYWNVAKFTDCELFATIGATSSSLNMYLAFRVALASDRTADPTTGGNWSGYFLTVDHTGDTVKLSSYNGASVTDLTMAMSVGGGLAVGDKVGASMSGTTIKVWYATAATSFAWTQLGADVTNTAYSSQGRLWLELAGTGLAWDDFGGGTTVAATQVLRPSADSVDGVWTDQAAGTALAAAIDETTPSDSDYIQSEPAPVASGSRVKLQAGSDPLSSSGHQIVWRPGKDVTGGQTMDMSVTLRQGGGNSLGGGTQIASFPRTNVDAFTTYTETLSGAQADSITNYSDLYAEFSADTASSSLLTWEPPGWNGTGSSRVAYTTNQTTAQAEVDAKYPGYTAVILNDTGNLGPSAYTYGGETWSVYLPNNQDFVLLLNHRNVALGNMQGIEIDGGRNVVLIGGTITGSLPTTRAAYDGDNAHAIDMRGQTGTMHLEGVLIDGYFVRGIRTDERTGSITVPAGTVQLQPSGPARYQFQNIRAPQLSMWKHNMGGLHMDFWILSGSSATQYVSCYCDKITCSWDHAGMASFHNDNIADGWFYSPFNYWKRTNLLSTKIQCPTAAHDYSAYALNHSRDTTLILDDFWLRSGWNYSGADMDCPTQSTQNDITQSIIQCTNRDGGLTLATTSDATHYAGVMTGDGKTQGNTLTFTDPAVDKVYGPDEVSGGVINWGIPPGGDFVPDGVAGASYVPPGYL